MIRKSLLLAAAIAASIVAPADASTATRLLLLTSVPFDADANAYFAQLAKNGCASPTLTFKRAVAKYVIAEKSALNWGNQDAFYLEAGSADACTAATNMAQPSLYKITWNGTVFFSYQNGLNGDASTGYGDTGVALNALVRMTQNNAHIEAWVAANKGNALGLLNVGTPVSLSPITNKTTRVNSGIAITDTGGGTAGLHYADRSSSSTASTGLNGVAQSNAVANSSSAETANNIVVCRLNAAFCAISINMLVVGFGGAMHDEAAHYRNVRAMLVALGINGV